MNECRADNKFLYAKGLKCKLDQVLLVVWLLKLELSLAKFTHKRFVVHLCFVSIPFSCKEASRAKNSLQFSLQSVSCEGSLAVASKRLLKNAGQSEKVSWFGFITDRSRVVKPRSRAWPGGWRWFRALGPQSNVEESATLQMEPRRSGLQALVHSHRLHLDSYHPRRASSAPRLAEW